MFECKEIDCKYETKSLHDIYQAKFITTGQDVVMQNNAVTCVTTTKFLGVIMDHKCKWKNHIL